MEVVISPGNMYQVIFMNKLETVNGMFSGSDFVEVTFSKLPMCLCERNLITLAI